VHAIGVEAGLGRRRLKEIIATLDTLGWVSVQRTSSGDALSISAESVSSLRRAGSAAGPGARKIDRYGLTQMIDPTGCDQKSPTEFPDGDV
jgi:hypothetical protein